MKPRFELRKATFRNSSSEIYFVLVAGNGEIVLTSETYKNRHGALNGIVSVKNNAINPFRYKRKSTVGVGLHGPEPYFVLRAGNNKTIGVSEVYSGVAAREVGIAAVAVAAVRANVVDTIPYEPVLPLSTLARGLPGATA